MRPQAIYIVVLIVAIFATATFFYISQVREQTSSIQIAPLLEEARNSPLLSIAGTDPVLLRERVQELSKVMHDLATIQENNENAEYVKAALYPVDFLYSLAELEEKRLVFIETRNAKSAEDYEKTLFKAIDAGESDIVRFSNVLNKIIEEDEAPPQFYSLSGTITTASLQDAVIAIQKRFQETRSVAEMRRECRARKSADCTSDTLHLKQQETKTSVETTSKTPLYLLEEIQNFFILVGDQLRPTEPKKLLHETLSVKLETSVCTREVEGPYHYFIFLKNELRPNDIAHFTNEIFFTPTDGPAGPVLKLLNEQGVNRAIVRPLSFYACPQTQHDLGMFAALKRIAVTADKYPHIARQERASLLEKPDMISESRARAYVSAAFAELKAGGESEEQIRHFEELSLMLSGRSADFDGLIRKIIDVGHARLRQYTEGLPFDVDARNLFLTHSAFPSLFLSHNPRAGETSVELTIKVDENKQRFLKTHERYSTVRTNTNIQSLVKDVVDLRYIDIAY